MKIRDFFIEIIAFIIIGAGIGFLADKFLRIDFLPWWGILCVIFLLLVWAFDVKTWMGGALATLFIVFIFFVSDSAPVIRPVSLFVAMFAMGISYFSRVSFVNALAVACGILINPIPGVISLPFFWAVLFLLGSRLSRHTEEEVFSLQKTCNF